MDRLRATTAHQISDRPPIQVRPGDEVGVGERDDEWPAFVFVTATAGSGWVPARFLSADSGPATVLRAYDTTELATAVDDVLEAIEHDVEGAWIWCRAADGREGWVPDRTLGPI